MSIHVHHPDFHVYILFLLYDAVLIILGNIIWFILSKNFWMIVLKMNNCLISVMNFLLWLRCGNIVENVCTCGKQKIMEYQYVCPGILKCSKKIHCSSKCCLEWDHIRLSFSFLTASTGRSSEICSTVVG